MHLPYRLQPNRRRRLVSDERILQWDTLVPSHVHNAQMEAIAVNGQVYIRRQRPRKVEAAASRFIRSSLLGRNFCKEQLYEFY